MNIETLQLRKEQARKQWKEYLNLLKTRGDKIKDKKELRQFKQLYYLMSRGMKVIDIYYVFKKSGLNKEGLPKMAIASANWKIVELALWNDGGACFERSRWERDKGDVRLPAGTFKTVEEQQYNRKSTKVPTVPARFRPNDLKNFFILWEVKKWTDVPRDPLLLRRITRNLFVIYAVWDLTPLERAFIRGR